MLICVSISFIPLYPTSVQGGAIFIVLNHRMKAVSSSMLQNRRYCYINYSIHRLRATLLFLCVDDGGKSGNNISIEMNLMNNGIEFFVVVLV